MLKIVICDDNIVYLDNISKNINRIISTNVIDGQIILKTQDAEAVDSFIKIENTNVFFLDIDLKLQDDSGYKLAQRIREKIPNAYIIFITSHFEYVLLAYKVYAFDFLVKPIPIETLEECVLRVYNNYLNSNISKLDNDILVIKSGSNINRIKKSDIIFIEHSNHKTNIHLHERSIGCYDSLENILDKLDKTYFLRCHKSYIANTKFIKSFNLKDRIIYFETGHKCYIGPKYKNIFNSNFA